MSPGRPWCHWPDPGAGDPTIPDADDTDADDAFGFPADLQLQRELDEVRRELARWPPAFSRLGDDEQRVSDMLWARQPQLSAAVAEYPFFAGTCGWVKAIWRCSGRAGCRV